MDFLRYLDAKETVDDRALNKDVWQALVNAVAARPGPLRVLDLGAGAGAMLRRLWRWGLHPHLDYTGVDRNPDAVTHGQARTLAWLQAHGGQGQATGPASGYGTWAGRTVRWQSHCADAAEWLAQARARWDVVVAHAFLDLVHLPTWLPWLAAAAPGGWGYLTLVFDGVTVFEPVPDPDLEARLMALYHRSMDERRTTTGAPAGHSQSGRRLFAALRATGARILAVGASDWVVHATDGRYSADEAYFLAYIVETVRQAVREHPALPAATVDAWAAQRREHIAQGTLVYMAHQLDFLVRWPT